MLNCGLELKTWFLFRELGKSLERDLAVTLWGSQNDCGNSLMAKAMEPSQLQWSL
jgi:hypothetical protein